MRAVGVESEMELAYASLHQLCVPLLDGLARLPGPQRDALRTVFGLSAGPAPERFLVGLAVLSLVSDAAEHRPLLCVVDDAQWLDRTSALTLAFVARRLLAEPVGLVFAAREPGAALRTCRISRSRAWSTARPARCSARRCGALDRPVRERILAGAGKPLALLELPRGMTPTQLAGGFGIRTRATSRPRSRRPTSGGSRPSPTPRGAYCWWRPPSRSAIRCSSNARASASGSRCRRSTRPTDCWPSTGA